MRQPNEVDFWRGFALVSIFINHIPGFFFERFTHRNFGLSDSAELFVFLAGWSLRRLVDAAEGPVGLGRLLLTLGARGVKLYAAQILITVAALGVVAASAVLLEAPPLLEWNNAAPVFADPVPAHIGLVLLTHQLGFFDILPLYIVLMLGSPALAIVHKASPTLVLPLSVAIYAVVLSFGLNLPTWPAEGTWYFNPFAWQLVFVLGFWLAGRSWLGDWARRHAMARRAVGAVVLAVGAVVVLRELQPDPMILPQPRLFFLFDKTFVTPPRLLHFLAVVATFAGAFILAQRYAPALARFGSMLGRNSLNVFCVGSILSLLGQVARFALGNDKMVDLAILVVGVVVLGFTAWLSELRERLRSDGRPSPA